MILALTGPSLTGKTTLARELACLYDWPLRVCGDDVRRAAAALQVALPHVPDEVHRTIDDATREWAKQNRPCIVDGRFLEYVLEPPTCDLVLIRLEASEAARHARSAERISRDAELPSVGQDDSADATLVARLYIGTEPAKSTLALDTSISTRDACLETIRQLLTSLPRA